MKLKFNGFLAMFLLLMAQLTFAQDKSVSGTVTDQSGLPLPGVNVLVKGTQNGVQTDFDGKFKVADAQGKTLVFSFTGMKTTEASASNGMKVKMADDSVVLEGVVVTALGIKKSEKALGYAMTSLKGDNIAQSRESNLINSLSGKVAGVQITNSSGAVGSSSKITIRGAKSIAGQSSPLYVLDGSPMNDENPRNKSIVLSDANSGGGSDLPNAVASINPDDIESISVLKGPAASALYGLRGANGVIIITTKSGKGSKNLGVSFNSNATFSNPLVLPNFQNSYGQGNRMDFFEFVDGAGGGVDDNIDESWGPALDKGLSFVQWDSFKNGGAATPWVSHPDNVKDFFDTGFSLSNNLSLTGNSEKINFRMGIGNSDEKGMVPFTDFKKTTITGNANATLSDNLSIGLALNYFNDKSNNLPTVGYANENPMQQFIWSARNVNFSDLRDWRNLPLAADGTPAAGTPLNWNNNYQNNPYWVLETNRNTFDRDRIVGNVNITYTFNPSWTLASKVALDTYSQLETSRKAIGTNSFIEGYYRNINRRFNEVNADILLTYKGKFTDDLEFSLSGGGNQMKNVYTLSSGIANALELPDVYTLNNVKTGTIAVLDTGLYESRINSLYSFGQLNYKNYAFLDITGRNDWASILPVKNNSFFYPSISTSLILSEMLGLKDYGIDYLKVRANWAKVGSLGPLSPYNTNRTFNSVSNGFGNQLFNNPQEFNSELEPENTTSKEVGIDLELFNKRLRFSGNIYNEKGQDLILPAFAAGSNGIARSFWRNSATMENNGIELALGATILKSKDFSFDIDLNYAKNENRVLSLAPDLNSYLLGGQWGVTLEARPGNQFGDIIGRGFVKDANGNVVYENGLPQIDATPKVLGNITPDFTGGANFAIRYKNFDLNTLIDAKIGGDVHSMTYAWGRYAGTLEETLIGRETGVVGDGVMITGVDANNNPIYTTNNVVVPAQQFNKASYGNTIEESAIFDASFVKLRQVALGYSIPKNWLNGTKISDFKFSVVARNLAILYKKVPHIDPETGFSSSVAEQGQEFGQLPSARTLSFNINVKF